jgi:prepilin-type N-terminal cleavage/methylation domain-containing protein
MWAKHKQESGFTIVELLIVIVVIAILAAISIVAYNGIQERANSNAIIARAEAYIKGLKIWQADTGLPTTSSCIAPSVYSSCDIGYWGGPIPNISSFNTQLATYSGVQSPQLGKYTVVNGNGTTDTPSGSMGYHDNWYGSGRAVLMYTVGPNSDCILSPLIDSSHAALAPASQKYTIRTSTFTRCEVALN